MLTGDVGGRRLSGGAVRARAAGEQERLNRVDGGQIGLDFGDRQF